MKFRLTLMSAVLCLSVVLAQPGLAQQLQPQEPELVQQMLADGWQKVADGVLQRGVGGSRVETFTYNQEGLRWMVQRMEERVSFLEHEYSQFPAEELARLIEGLKGEILAAEASLSFSPGRDGRPRRDPELQHLLWRQRLRRSADRVLGAGRYRQRQREFLGQLWLLRRQHLRLRLCAGDGRHHDHDQDPGGPEVQRNVDQQLCRRERQRQSRLLLLRLRPGLERRAGYQLRHRGHQLLLPEPPAGRRDQREPGAIHRRLHALCGHHVVCQRQRRHPGLLLQLVCRLDLPGLGGAR